MPRRSGVPKRDVLPDPIYNSKVITKLINQVMYDGKRGTAQRIVYDAFNIVKEKMGLDENIRGEKLSIAQFGELSELLK